ncbi:agouti signaling protein 1 [Syngnathoides biaculeatus]|uniref:agouti signaling protein 1 n=1 Tax=Syngnathoides biaculeatus TaxID=300417 RepID=UPI002ADE84B3|nr:agouti signaling protein 1 [Syngnathoides biaculeatus]XP_061687578.1 agouti signaling protein 1 [Syngnathoides biaculeatus]
MQAWVLLASIALTAWHVSLAGAHMMPDDRLSGDKAAVSNAVPSNPEPYAPVVIVELPKPAKKKKAKKNKRGGKRRPPPAPGCVPLWGSCKSSGKVCCDFCAFCHCRIFRTVCYCRMGNPRC